MLKASSPLFAGVFALLFGAVQTARADTIVVTSDVTAATLTEGQSLVVTYTAVITVSDSNGALVGGFISPQVGPSGDLTDILDNVADSSPLFNCVGQTFFIAGNGTAANTCSFRITFIGVQDAVVEDSDSGSATARLGLS